VSDRIIKDFKKYRDFLATIPLDKYREELKDIKWVEQDLPNSGFNIQIFLGRKTISGF